MGGKPFSEIRGSAHDREKHDDPESFLFAIFLGAMFRAVCAPLAESKSLDDLNEGEEIEGILRQFALRHRAMFPARAAKLLSANPFLGHPLPSEFSTCRDVYDAWEKFGERLQYEAGTHNRAMQESYSYVAFTKTLAAFEDVRDWYDVRALLNRVLVRHRVANVGSSGTVEGRVTGWIAPYRTTLRTLVAAQDAKKK